MYMYMCRKIPFVTTKNDSTKLEYGHLGVQQVECYFKGRRIGLGHWGLRHPEGDRGGKGPQQPRQIKAGLCFECPLYLHF